MIKINRNDLIILNDLVQVSSALKINRIKDYILQLDKTEKAIIIERYQGTGRFGVLLRKELEDIKKDEMIPISDAEKLGEYLNKIAEDEVIKISVKDNTVIFEHDNGKLKLSSYEESEDESEARGKIRKAFETVKYGDDDNKLTYYKSENEEDPDPDAISKVDLKRLKLKTINSVFNIKHINLKVKEGRFHISAKEEKGTEIERVVQKGEKDAMNVEGECEILLQDLDCVNMLSQFDGMTTIEMKVGFPLVLKKKLPENRIGINYIVSIMETVEEEEQEEVKK